ncbi:hypothetical protein BSLG_006606 [Batrachochytrium salamandrivorans]|nr:hypothetical protein BSLG_006606 [Batrachochytrium salamandrivorans]
MFYQASRLGFSDMITSADSVPSDTACADDHSCHVYSFQSETRLVSTDMCVDNASLTLSNQYPGLSLARTRQHAAQRSSSGTITTSQERVGGIHPLADHCMRLMLVFLNPLSKLIHITDKALVMHDLESMISHHVSMNDLHTTNQDIYSRIIELVEKMASSVDKKPVVSSPVLMPLASPNTSEPLHTDSIHTYSDLHPLLSSETDCTLDVEASSLYQTPKLHDLINLLQYPTIPTSYMQPSNTHMDMLSCHDIDVEDPIAFDLEHLMQCVNNLQKDYPINYAPSLLIEYVEDTPTSVVSFTSAIGPLGSHDSRLSAWGSEDPALLDSGDSLAVPMFDDDFAVDDFVLVDFELGLFLYITLCSLS